MKIRLARLRHPKRYIISSTVALAVVVSTFALLPVASIAEPQRGEFMIVNKSRFTIYKLFLSPSNNRRWGRDQLGRRTIKPGDSFTLNRIPCGLYDVKVVDEDGDACEIREISMCRDHTHWDLTNDDLLRCEGFR
ncbi:MAG TPA: hypothetical protein VGX92_18985 [Pyrinomonadaceae bacterium]|jgi:hypothetical protein|nr:hypothetical protein [Pyrinomonadaceae bacterium]